jgi:hypothetical protein
VLVTVRNQHRPREAFRFFFKRRQKRFEWLAIRILRRVVEVGTRVKTDNNCGRIQRPGLIESLT